MGRLGLQVWGRKHSGNINLDHYIKVLSTRFLNCSVTVFPLPYSDRSKSRNPAHIQREENLAPVHIGKISKNLSSYVTVTTVIKYGKIL